MLNLNLELPFSFNTSIQISRVFSIFILFLKYTYKGWCIYGWRKDKPMDGAAHGWSLNTQIPDVENSNVRISLEPYNVTRLFSVFCFLFE